MPEPAGASAAGSPVVVSSVSVPSLVPSVVVALPAGASVQLLVPSASASSTITGSTSVTLSTLMSPESSGPSATRTSSACSVTMSAVDAPSTLAKRTPSAVSVGAGRIESERSPSIASARPVAFSASAAISGLYLFQSTKLGPISTAATSSTTRPMTT